MEWMRSLAALGVAASLTSVPLGSSADTLDQPFLITTTGETADGTTSFRDVILVHGTTAARSITADTATDATRFARDQTCFAIIGRISDIGPTRKPYAIGVMVDGQHLLPVPITANLEQPAGGARLLEAAGDAGGDVSDGATHVRLGVHIDARVLAQDGHLESATFRQITYLNSLAQTVDVSSCSLQRLPVAPAAPSDTNAAPAAPA